MLMISDAGPLGAGDPTSQTGLSPEALADYLRENRIYLTALHLKTPAAIQNHRYAAEAYRTLTMQSDNQASCRSTTGMPICRRPARRYSAIRPMSRNRVTGSTPST